MEFDLHKYITAQTMQAVLLFSPPLYATSLSTSKFLSRQLGKKYLTSCHHFMDPWRSHYVLKLYIEMDNFESLLSFYEALIFLTQNLPLYVHFKWDRHLRNSNEKKSDFSSVGMDKAREDEGKG